MAATFTEGLIEFSHISRYPFRHQHDAGHMGDPASHGEIGGSGFVLPSMNMEHAQSFQDVVIPSSVSPLFFLHSFPHPFPGTFETNSSAHISKQAIDFKYKFLSSNAAWSTFSSRMCLDQSFNSPIFVG